jgi:hypothetical protein
MRLADYKSESPMMSKRISRFLALLFVLALAIAGLPAGRFANNSSAQKAGITTGGARNTALIEATEEVLKETSEIRELSILRPVKSSAQSRSEIEHMLISNLNEEMTSAQMHAAEVSLRKFGLAPADFEYRDRLIKLLTEQVAGYYDAKSQQFHLADWLGLEVQKPVMAHELTHALQDQHFNLRRFEKWPHGDSDAELAVHALVEGDATLAMTIYLAKNPLVALAFTRSLTTGVPTEQYDQMPRALRESLIFPYLRGSEWATQLYRRGGWELVSNAFTKLPLSTEQIIHTEKYFSYERPVKIVLPDVSNLLNAGVERTANSKQQTAVASLQQSAFSSQKSGRRLPPADRQLPTAHAWHRIDSDVNGEWNYYLILDQFLESPVESKRAAAGWAGDRYAVYEGPNGQVLLAQVAAWDTENDAREFFDAYVKRTELRYPGAKRLDAPESDPQTRNSKLETRNSFSWQTNEGEVVIELRGSRVVILEGIPEGVDAKTLMKAPW